MRSNSDVGTSPGGDAAANGRVPTFTELARRRQIIVGAVDVLAELGYAGTSLAAIATHLGVSKGILSYHFAGKSDLLQAVVETILADAAESMTVQISAAPTFRDALNRYIRANLDFLSQNRAKAIALVEVLGNARTIPGIPELYAQAQAGAISAAEALFAGGVAAGEFVVPSPRALAMVLRASIDTVTERMRADDEFDVDLFSTELTDIFVRVLR